MRHDPSDLDTNNFITDKDKTNERMGKGWFVYSKKDGVCFHETRRISMGSGLLYHGAQVMS